MSRFAFAIALVVATGCACSKQSNDTPSTAGAGAGTAAAAPLPTIVDNDQAAAKAAEPDTSYKLAVSLPAAGPAGTPAVARVQVVPGAGWHMNKDYPTKLKLTAPEGVTIDKPVLEGSEATKLDDNELSFDVKCTPTKAGTYKVDGELKFAVCTPETCDPKKQTIAFELVAQ